MGGESKIKRFILVVLLAALLLAGCSPRITEGEVIDKEFSPAHSITSASPVMISNGKSITTILVPRTYTYPAEWRITILGYDEDGNRVTETFRVTEEVFDATEIGAKFVWDESMEPSY